MEDKITLLDIWDIAEPKERAEFVAGLCKKYPSLICEILKKQASCPASVMKEYLFDTGVSKK